MPNYGVSTPAANSPVFTYGVDRERRDLEVAKEIARLVPDANPFLSILQRAKKSNTRTAEFSWYDSEPGAWWTKMTASADDSETTLDVSDATIFRPWDVIKVPRTTVTVLADSSTAVTRMTSPVRGQGTSS